MVQARRVCPQVHLKGHREVGLVGAEPEQDVGVGELLPAVDDLKEKGRRQLMLSCTVDPYEFVL